MEALFLRIHGDNIIECERGLYLIANSYSASLSRLVGSPYMPRYEVLVNSAVLFTVDLLPGHGRWGVSVQGIFKSHGAPLRETTDVIITRILKDENVEEVLLAVEFSSALPAGNNAWQRNGRALACAVAGIPYLYFTEVGGVELGVNRIVKAARFPNPIVPFSYLAASKAYRVLCLPVYASSPSSSETIYTQFQQVIGVEDAKPVIRYAVEGKLIPQSYEGLAQKAMSMTKILSSSRKQIGTLHGDEWAEFLHLDTSKQKVNWLIHKEMSWRKKRASKVETTVTFQRLTELFAHTKTISVGSSDIPICLIPENERPNLAAKMLTLYGDLIDIEFINWLATNSPLLIVWITGFKPGGDDSRPDRGLIPLARMLFGDEIEILSIISGPAKPEMWATLQTNSERLAQQNGLWEAIIHLSNAILVDSPTLMYRPLTQLLVPVAKQNEHPIRIPIASPVMNFSEHDVDTVIHLLFSTNVEMGIFEAMCNPPGGDWSGLSTLDFLTGEEFRWTSLPRVSGIGGKRPDHVIQFGSPDEKITLLAIESKDKPSKIPVNLGPSLKAYVNNLIQTSPISAKAVNEDWRLWKSDVSPMSDVNIISGGAFCWTNEGDLAICLNKCQLEIAIAIEFNSDEQSALFHITVSPVAEFLLPKIHHLMQQFGGRLKIQVHRFDHGINAGFH